MVPDLVFHYAIVTNSLLSRHDWTSDRELGTLTLKKRTARLSLDRRVVGTQAPPVDAAARVFVILSGAGDDAGAVRTIAAHTREGRRHGWRRARNSDEVKRE